MPEFSLDRFEHGTAIAALVHYALHVADADEVVRTLDILSPHPSGSWSESIHAARDSYRELLRRAEEPVVRAPDAWRRVAVEGRRFA